MGSAQIYYYPRGATSFKTITLPRLSDLIIEDHRLVRDARSYQSATYRADLGGYRTVRIISERLTDAALIRQLRTLDAHLRAGGRCAFVRDSDLAVAYRSAAALSAGATTIPVTSSNLFPFNGSASLSSGEEVTIEDPNPDLRREFVRFASVSGSTVTVSDALTYGYTGQTLIRYADFFPVLRFGESEATDGQFFLSEHRRNWTLDLMLEELPGEVNTVASSSEALATDTITTIEGGVTIEGILRQSDLLGSTQLVEATRFSLEDWSPYGMG